MKGCRISPYRRRLRRSWTQLLFARLNEVKIETPTWGYVDTGTIDEKLSEDGTVHRYTGCRPTFAVHALRDFPGGRGRNDYGQGSGAKRGAK